MFEHPVSILFDKHPVCGVFGLFILAIHLNRIETVCLAKQGVQTGCLPNTLETGCLNLVNRVLAGCLNLVNRVFAGCLEHPRNRVFRIALSVSKTRSLEEIWPEIIPRSRKSQNPENR